MADENERFVLLNRLVSRSSTRAKYARPPTHSGSDLLQILAKRHAKGWAIEFTGIKVADEESDEVRRRAQGVSHNFIRLRQMKTTLVGGYRYAILLFEHVNIAMRSFPVVDTATFEGREIAGEDNERGATAAHVIVRLPEGDAYDDGSYRCGIEVVPPITRRAIESFISHQLRRDAEAHGGWSFTESRKKKRGKGVVTKEYQYSPRLELHADIGRRLADGALTGNRILSSMIFTRRKMKQSIGNPSAFEHEEFDADVELRVNARQGPEDAEERAEWGARVKKYFDGLGYDSHFTYRHTKGTTLSGDVHHSVDGAADLLMCQKELISNSHPFKPWLPSINAETVERIQELLNKDTLWERAA